jgi:hypothetical protein
VGLLYIVVLSALDGRTRFIDHGPIAKSGKQTSEPER